MHTIILWRIVIAVWILTALSVGTERPSTVLLAADHSDVEQRSSEAKDNALNRPPASTDRDLNESGQRLYVATSGQLLVFKLSDQSGELTLIQKLKINGIGPFTFAPNRKWMYAVTETSSEDEKSPAISTLQIAKDGTLKLAHTAMVESRPGYLMTDDHGQFLAGSHYGPGKATIWKLDPLYRGVTTQELTLEKKTHSIVFSPDNRWLLVPATEPNKVFVNYFDDKSGTAKPNHPSFAIGPQGKDNARQPRHLIFHPNLPIFYTSNERDLPGVGVWQWDSERGSLAPVQNIVTERNESESRITTADLHLTPNARFLFVSNRDISRHKSEAAQDSIVGFRVEPHSGHLKMIGHTPCERVPRSFTIDRLGRYLIVAGQADGRLGVYRIEDSGALTKLHQYNVPGNPVWIEMLSIFD